MTLSKGLVVNIIIWIALLVYLIFAMRHCSVRNSDIICTGVNVVVKDSSRYRFVSPQSVEQILRRKNIRLDSVRLDSIDILAVENVLSENPYIKQRKVYTTINGKLNIEIRQRKPLVRIQTDNGYKVYITDDLFVVPVDGSPVDVPIVTGVPELPFESGFTGYLTSYTEDEKKTKKMTILYII
ncbi:MAG: hypothetical protein LUF90_00040 [Rikenellaceae bacterium]|nr:hypothetical protein [Rikenellaceae bacterium]